MALREDQLRWPQVTDRAYKPSAEAAVKAMASELLTRSLGLPQALVGPVTTASFKLLDAQGFIEVAQQVS